MVIFRVGCDRRNDFFMTFGQKIKNRRRELGMTQVELRAKTGLLQGYISMLEKGMFDPTAPVIIKLAVTLNTSADELPKSVVISKRRFIRI